MSDLLVWTCILRYFALDGVFHRVNPGQHGVIKGPVASSLMPHTGGGSEMVASFMVVEMDKTIPIHTPYFGTTAPTKPGQSRPLEQLSHSD